MKAIVIGSGVAGMAVAIRLQLKGYRVTVFEANSTPGGKLAEVRHNGYRFDAGPSLFTLPRLVDELFHLASKNPKDYFEYSQLPLVTKYFFEDGTTINAHSDSTAFANEMERKLGEPRQRVLGFLDRSRELYDLTEHIFLNDSLHKFSTYTKAKTLKTGLKLHRLDFFRSMHQANEKHFTNEKAVRLFDRFATYNGSDPYQAPATLNIIPHLEHNIGAYFPKGGMYDITKALLQLGEELGVKYHFNTKVERIHHSGGRVTGVQAGGETLPADLVVSNMDIVNSYRHLLPDEKEPTRITSQPKSSSALIFYWGIKKPFPQLDVHNIFFSESYKAEFEQLFEKGGIHHDPTVYIYCSSKVVPADAPEGCENWFTMINVPNNSGQDWDKLKLQARNAIITKLNRMLQTDVEPLIQTEDTLDPVLIEQRTSSHQGALYGNSSNNIFAAFLRHANFSSKLKGLYFCGGSVHPGGGIPLCLLSARIVDHLIEEPKRAT